MIGRALRDGVRSATRQPGLVALLWAWNLALALLVTLPFWRWVDGVSAVFPQTDALLDGLDLGLVSQLVAADIDLVPSLLAAVGGLIVVSLVSGALLAGGILEVVATGLDERPLLHRFFRGAGHFFGRFLRLLAIGGVSLVVCTVAVAAGLSAAARALIPAGAEAARFWTSLAVPVAAGLVVAFFLVALDFARVMTVLSDERRMLRTWWRAVRFVVRHTGGTAIIALAAALVVVGAMAACIAVERSYAARSWVVIVAVIVVQQAMALVRTAARVGQWSAEASFARAALPAAPAGVEATAAPAEDVARKDLEAAPETIGEATEPE